MTRINLVDPAELHSKHLIAEVHELPRVFTLARKAQHVIHKKKIPTEYVLGVGHVLFFYNKLTFLVNRYQSLCSEMRKRGYNVNQIAKSDLLKDISNHLQEDYNPTFDAINLNRQRIKERTKPSWK